MKAWLILALILMAPVPRALAQDGRELRLSGDLSAAIRGCGHLTIFDAVAARVEDGTVVLIGKVTLPAKKQEVERLVARLDGVRAVRNDIVVLPRSPSDEELRRRVARAIYGNPSFWSYAAMAHPPIHIIVDRGHVTLQGTVGTAAERTMARSLASGLGEHSIVNELQTGMK